MVSSTSHSFTEDVEMEPALERLAFKNRTNRCDGEKPKPLPQDKKRPANEDNKSSRKRVRLTASAETKPTSEEEEEDDVVLLSGSSSRRWSMFAMRNTATSYSPFAYSRLPQSTSLTFEAHI